MKYLRKYRFKGENSSQEQKWFWIVFLITVAICITIFSLI